MAPKSSKNSSKPSKEKEVFDEPVISSEEEDPEEDEEEETNPTPLNGFVSDSGSDYDSDNSGYKVEPVPKAVQVVPSPKRPSGSTNANPSKKPKTMNTNTISTMTVTPGSKKQSGGNGNSVSRIWLKEDEIVMLTELYDFKKSKGGVDVNLDMAAFYDSVKGKLSGEYTKDQLKSKIRHMKAKYMGIVKKIEKGSGDSVGFASSHEALVFDLSKKAWGHVVKEVDNNVVVETVVKENEKCVGDGKKKKKSSVNAEVENVVMVDANGEKEKEGVEERFVDVSSYKFLNESIGVSKYQECLGLSDAAFKLMNENLHLIGKENASDLDGDWKELFMEEVELNLKRASLLKKQAELVFDCIKKP